MELDRKIRLFFVSYGRIIFRIIGVIALIIIAVQTLNKMAIEKREKEKMKYLNYKANNSINTERNNMQYNKNLYIKRINRKAIKMKESISERRNNKICYNRNINYNFICIYGFRYVH